MVRERICSDIWLGVWWCYFLGIYKVLDGMVKAQASVSVMAMALVEFTKLGRVMIFG